MLGNATLCQLTLCEFPVSAAVVTSPAWRRWLAQECSEAALNIRPTNDDVRAIIAHMFDEACKLYPDAPASTNELLQYLPPSDDWPSQDTTEFLTRLARELRDDQFLVVPVGRPTVRQASEDDIISALLLASINALPTVVPQDKDDNDEELEAILLASIH